MPVYAAVKEAPAPLAEGDRDGDGLPDVREAELSRRYAPVVLLDKDDWTRPASVPWVMARVDIETDEPLAPVTAASAHPRKKTRGFDHATRHGSDDPADWVTYVDVYPRVDGGINLQYWFYYPFNDGPLFFDHESDWEHITVRLDERGEPLGAYLARHEDNDPGPYFAWSRLQREGDHPVVLSARGSHATYANARDVAWFDSAGACADLGHCAGPVWRTWEGGGLARFEDLDAAADVARLFRFPGRWGATGFLPGTSAPRAPTHQAGFCTAGFPTCRRLPGADRPPSLPAAAAARGH